MTSSPETQDEYSRPSRNALVGVHGYLMVYSTTSKASFEKVRLINDILLNMLGDTPDVPRVLVATMADLAEQR
jgi:Ras family protein